MGQAEPTHHAAVGCAGEEMSVSGFFCHGGGWYKRTVELSFEAG